MRETSEKEIGSAAQRHERIPYQRVLVEVQCAWKKDFLQLCLLGIPFQSHEALRDEFLRNDRRGT